MKKFLTILMALLMLLTLCACGNDEAVTPDGMKAAGKAGGNEAVQFSFFYPEEWELIRDTGTIELKFDCDESEARAVYATITVVAFDLKSSEADMKARDYWNDRHKDEVEGIYDDFKILNGEGDETKLGGTVALKVKYQGKINKVSYYNEQIICCRNGSVYFLTLVVPEECKDKVKGSLERVAKDFEFDEAIF